MRTWYVIGGPFEFWCLQSGPREYLDKFSNVELTSATPKATCKNLPILMKQLPQKVVNIGKGQLFLLEKAMATHSSTLAWRIPWTEKPVGYSPWGLEESDMTEWLHFHFSLSCIEEGNGNPLQYSSLENPRDRGAWWAAIYGVIQSQTWLMQLSSSSRRFSWIHGL